MSSAEVSPEVVFLAFKACISAKTTSNSISTCDPLLAKLFSQLLIRCNLISQKKWSSQITTHTMVKQTKCPKTISQSIHSPLKRLSSKTNKWVPDSNSLLNKIRLELYMRKLKFLAFRVQAALSITTDKLLSETIVHRQSQIQSNSSQVVLCRPKTFKRWSAEIKNSFSKKSRVESNRSQSQLTSFPLQNLKIQWT